MESRTEQRGISFRDVAAYLEQLRKDHGGYFSFTVAYDVSRESGLRLSVVLERRDHVVVDKCVNHPRRAWAYWPDKQSNTFAGLMYRLCYELDGRIASDNQVKREQLLF